MMNTSLSKQATADMEMAQSMLARSKVVEIKKMGMSLNLQLVRVQKKIGPLRAWIGGER